MIYPANVPKRIVLSRKGFDSSAGGCASPILDGKPISLPIPDPDFSRNSNSVETKQLCFADFRKRNCSEIADLASALSNQVTDASYVHLDPDLRPELRTPKCWDLPAAFGQCSGSQTELKMIDEGDLFLFFGWFRAVSKQTDHFIYQRSAPDQHLIWGWLQVEQKLVLPDQIEMARKLAPEHPHVQFDAQHPNNCLYIGKKDLGFLKDKSGSGTFVNYRSGLVLSDPQSNLYPRQRKRSRWNLPAFFSKVKMTRVSFDNWTKQNGRIVGDAANCRGQEFIFETKCVESEVATWLEEIFVEK
jgi:hypothetical protein